MTSTSQYTLDTRGVAHRELVAEVHGLGLPGPTESALRHALRSPDTNVALWVRAILDMPAPSRDVRLGLLAFVAKHAYEDGFTDVGLPRVMFMSWADDELLNVALKATDPPTHYSTMDAVVHRVTVFTDIYNILTNASCPREAKLIRLASLCSGKRFPATTNWESLTEAYHHVGSLPLVETLFGAASLVGVPD